MRDNFDLATELAEMAEDDPLSVIPKDTPRERLFEVLKPILESLKHEPELTREVCLKRMDKHLGLSKEEAKALRKDFKGLCKSQKSPQENDKDMPTALGQGLVDVVEYDGLPAFLTTDGEVVRQLTIDGETYCPPAKEALPFLLPRAEAVLEAIESDTDGQLYQDIRNYIYTASDLPGDGWYDLLTAWVLHTYLIEKAEYSPYVWFYAVPERGKSRTGKALIHIAYRGFYTESLRDAYLVRIAKTLGASLFLDVFEIWKKAAKYGTEDILLNRYERGSSVPRVLHPDKGAFKDTVYFPIFGATLIATNETVPTALDSRAVQINMQPATRNFKNDIRPQLALPLKERLVAFRYRHMSTTMPNIEKPSLGRLGDILKPLAQIIRLVQPEREIAFMELVKEIEERRGIDRGETTEAKLVKAIVDLEDAVEYGRLSVKQITEKFNEGTVEKYHSRPETISRKLVALGFVRVRSGGGKRSIIYDEILVKKLALTYLESASQPSQPTKATTGVGFSCDSSGDSSDTTLKASQEPSHGKVNNYAGFGSSDSSDSKTQGVSEEKKKSFFLPVEDDDLAQEVLPWR
ncbi:MAG: hypothetical protein Q8M92_08760 [Candidatus Subteraquimicrobiales bacterium]|nr:hypothetical protein [Candidatus Subteraquimicrobiales bacterium]